MGGYMGFGMASWIYKQRPRKAFSKRKRRPTCNTLPSYERTFKLQPSTKSSRWSLLVTIMLLGLFFTSFYFKAPVVIRQTNTMLTLKKERIERENIEAFDFLYHSGIRRLHGNNLKGAYSEFKLAQAIYPEHEALNQLMIETLTVLCEDDNGYCDELDALLSKLL
ncbi:hypothetical protein [Psychroserpens sp. SPM9]|uniref:hypothetical protein n=1 Tax=Psychroserpens sp. SPM9 TaxID=2975598 RepID=UPI0021A27BED|nr:hypothetical protein [Psychroserpens sp. SPM9]MDG5491872.1 hypothetical protein [Psychroserpens sp. SPM9]